MDKCRCQVEPNMTLLHFLHGAKYTPAALQYAAGNVSGMVHPPNNVIYSTQTHLPMSSSAAAGAGQQLQGFNVSPAAGSHGGALRHGSGDESHDRTH